MTQQGVITIVHGYHSDTPIPEQVYKCNLNYRFAVVFETAFPEHSTSVFQSKNFMMLLSAISEQLDYDNLRIVADENNRYLTIDSFQENLFKVSEDDRMPPQRIFFKKNDDLTCMEETEFWVLCGGSAPYSDSYTTSFYTRNNMADAFDTACKAVCLDMGIEMRGRVQGSPTPVRSFWKKICTVIER